MTTYGPITGITKDNLFDTIVNNIDATLSGNSTGWNLIKDGRDATRVPTADGLSSIVKPLPTSYTTTNVTEATLGASDTMVTPLIVFRNSGTIYMEVGYRNSTSTASSAPIKWLLSSVDGESWTNISTSFTGLAVRDTDSFTPTQMADGRNWRHIIDGVSGNLVITADPDYTDEIVIEATTTYTGSAGQTIPDGSYNIREELGGDFIPSPYCFKHSNTKATFFAVAQDNSTGSIIRYTLEGADFATALSNHVNGTTTNQCQQVITKAQLACGFIMGVVDVEQIRSDLYRVVVRTCDAKFGDVKYKQFYIESELHPSSYEAYSITNITDLGVDNVNMYYKQRQAGLDVNIKYTDGYDITQVNGSTSATFDLDVASTSEAGGDAIPDAKGVEYEYCVLESDNNGEQVIIAQVNPESAQPSVTGLTDTLPILVRPVASFNVEDSMADLFYFDPINAADQVAIAPAVLSVPDVLADPEETFRYWMKVNARQIFFYCESTNGTNQHFHVNIPDKVIPYDASNIVVMSSGTLTGTGGVMLRGLSYSATLDLRGDSKQYYPRSMELTYSTILTDTNAVDGRDVSTDVFVASNVSAFGVAPNANLFLAGRLYDTKYPTNNAGLSSGDEDTIQAATYKFFRTDTTASVDNPTTVKPLMIKWV